MSCEKTQLLPTSTGISKRGTTPFGRLNEGSPEGGEIRNLPPLARLCLLSARTESKAAGRHASISWMIMVFSIGYAGKTDCHDQSADWSRNDRTGGLTLGPEAAAGSGAGWICLRQIAFVPNAGTRIRCADKSVPYGRVCSLLPVACSLFPAKQKALLAECLLLCAAQRLISGPFPSWLPCGSG